ncbi:unnamed protein product [Cercopithifilaria johnstoni]|uniref:G-protein coupled receptors family 1 profile domain-containing protein n=1 Tax=Cercopithifilaria johnstoni TaxID=2874296 RepID=A0A8J2LN31_9BILA|nr:unnamed protein product [Cercopithifilaria johnstoni]
MSFAVNETATERIKNVNANEKEAIVRAISIILHTYGYIVIGIFLTSINIPVFLLVITRKALRSPYLVLAIVFLNNGLTGICAILTGIKRIIDTANGEKLIDHYKCVLNVHTFLLTLFFLNGWSLLMHSLERLCVVAFPIYYYKKSARISYSLIAAQYIIAIIEITSTVIASLIESPRRISNFCTLQSSYSPLFFKTLINLTSLTSMLSIIVMVIVVAILRRKFGRQFLTRHSHNRDLSTFLDNQKRYTHTSLISCCFTFFFVVAPSALEYIYVMDSSVLSRIIIMCCAYLWILNSFNMVVLFLYRQGDSQRAAIRCFKYLLCERKHTVQPMVVFGIGK